MSAKDFSVSCPIPIQDYPYVLLAHGGGGKLMHQMVEKMFKEVFVPDDTVNSHDSAVLNCSTEKIAFTTDSYVVHPLVFPGGDIGKLAVNGTVNDLAMSGARPAYLSIAFILEEGLAMETLWQVVQSIKQAADEASARIVTGDTKVVDKGKGDGIFINTAGVGLIDHQQVIAPSSVQKGDVILLNGDIARHGMAVMAVREGLEFESSIESDSAPLADLVFALLNGGVEIHCLRDLTRGGLASTLNEIAIAAKVGIKIDESIIPVREDVAAACEILGLDPLYVANEGRFAAFIPAKDKERALAIMKGHSVGEGSCVIGEVADNTASLVTMKSRIGVARIIDMLSGEQLPRIC
ncbi:MAG: hydrogenase expression/formation protein HypE [Candidatus Omnitrophica bacterium]|nr:hydrogenase expression/formation protein HypE [Candidatus Omnitrophota bacterium]